MMKFCFCKDIQTCFCVIMSVQNFSDKQAPLLELWTCRPNPTLHWKRYSIGQHIIQLISHERYISLDSQHDNVCGLVWNADGLRTQLSEPEMKMYILVCPNEFLQPTRSLKV